MKGLLIFSVFLVTVFGQCPDSTWTMLSDNKRCIKLFERLLPRDPAKDYCEQTELGYLATIKNAADDATFAALAGRDGVDKGVWMGLYKVGEFSTVWQWFDKSPVTYTNWQPDYNIATATSGCVAFNTATSKWRADVGCGAYNYLMCQTAAFVRTGSNLLVKVGRDDYFQSEGFAYPNGPGVEANIADRNTISISDIADSYQLVVIMKYRASANSNITVYDAATGEIINRYEGSGTVGAWNDVYLQTHAWLLKIIAYSARKASLAYNITVSLQPKVCQETTYIPTTASQTLYSYKYPVALSEYKCTSIIKSAGPTTKIWVSVIATTSGDAKIIATDVDTGAIIKQYQSGDGSTVNWSISFSAAQGHSVKIQTSAGKQGYFYHSLLYYYR